MKWLANMEVLWFDLLQSDWLYVTSLLTGSLLQVFLLGLLLQTPGFFYLLCYKKSQINKEDTISMICSLFLVLLTVSLLKVFWLDFCYMYRFIGSVLQPLWLVVGNNSCFFSVSAGIPGYPEPPVIEEITTGEFEVSWLPPHDFGENITYYLLQYRYYIDSAASACLVLSKIVVAWWLVESYARAWAWLGYRASAMCKYCWPCCKTETQPTIFIPPLQNGVLGGYTVFSMSVIPKFRDSILLSTFKVLINNFDSFCPILFTSTPHFNHETMHVW